MVPERIERETQIDAPREVVWAIVTEPEHVAGWFSDQAEIDLRSGGAAILTWTEHGRVRARVEEVDPPRLFSFRWGRPFDTEPTADSSTLVEFHLSEQGEGTLLRVVESGFRELGWSEEDKATYAEENAQGWAVELDELRAYVADRVHGTARS